LLTNRAIRSEVLSKNSSTIDNSLPSTVIVYNQRIKGNSTTSNQLVVGSIIVRAIKSMTVKYALVGEQIGGWYIKARYRSGVYHN
jgi:hypothetical protein